MPNDGKNQNTPSIWAWKNTAHITKMGVEGTVAAASLAAATTAVLAAAGAIAGPAFLASIANPVGTAALFVAAVYFTAAAYSSYQQMHKNEEISGAVTKAEGTEVAAKKAEAARKAVEAKAENFASKDDLNKVNTELGKKLDSDKLKEALPTLLQDPKVVTADVKTAVGVVG